MTFLRARLACHVDPPFVLARRRRQTGSHIPTQAPQKACTMTLLKLTNLIAYIICMLASRRLDFKCARGKVPT